MNKRGISPLIATVLIIGFTVALAAIIITWGTRFVTQVQEDVDVSTKVQLTCAKLDFEIARVECTAETLGTCSGGTCGAETCSVTTDCSGCGGTACNWYLPSGNLKDITINSNTAENIVGFTFRSTDAAGTQVKTMNSDTDALSGFGSNKYTWGGANSTKPTKLEAIAYINIEGKPDVCSAVIETVKDTISANGLCGFSV